MYKTEKKNKLVVKNWAKLTSQPLKFLQLDNRKFARNQSLPSNNYHAKGL